MGLAGRACRLSPCGNVVALPVCEPQVVGDDDRECCDLMRGESWLGAAVRCESSSDIDVPDGLFGMEASCDAVAPRSGAVGGPLERVQLLDGHVHITATVAAVGGRRTVRMNRTAQLFGLRL